jgi:hypothetical protein
VGATSEDGYCFTEEAMSAPAQLPDESDKEFRSFLGWLMSKPRRLPEDDGLALKFDWARRAAAFDRVFSGPASPDITTPQTETTKRNLERLVALEVQKYLLRSEGATDVPVLTPAELIRLVAVVTGKGSAKDLDGGEEASYIQNNEQEPDLSGLSSETLDELERMWKK